MVIYFNGPDVVSVMLWSTADVPERASDGLRVDPDNTGSPRTEKDSNICSTDRTLSRCNGHCITSHHEDTCTRAINHRT